MQAMAQKQVANSLKKFHLSSEFQWQNSTLQIVHSKAFVYSRHSSQNILSNGCLLIVMGHVSSAPASGFSYSISHCVNIITKVNKMGFNTTHTEIDL